MSSPSARELGHTVGDLERAVAIFAKVQLDPGHLASAKWALGRELWSRDPARARSLIDEAMTLFETAGGAWQPARADAASWLREQPGRSRPQRRG
jgi:hypothetical protein